MTNPPTEGEGCTSGGSEAASGTATCLDLLTAARERRLPKDVINLAHRSRNPQDHARYLVAAAVSGGATLILSGCRSGGLRGVADFEKSENLVHAANSMVDPPAAVDITRLQDEDGAGLVVVVSASDPDLPPPSVNAPPPFGGAFELVRGRPRPLSEERIGQLKRVAGVGQDELRAASTWATLDPSVITRLTDRTLVGRPADPTGALHALGVVASPRTGAPFTRAAVAAAGLPRTSAQWCPRFEYRRHSYSLAEAVSGARRDLAPQVFEGGVAVILPALEELLNELTAGSAAASAAVREAIVNAVGHRSYADEHRAEPIYVEHYGDAVLVRSPGAPLARVRMEDERGPQVRFGRNPHLMHMLQLLGLATNNGRGRELMRGTGESHLQPGRFDAGPDWFGVALQVRPPEHCAIHADRLAFEEGEEDRLPSELQLHAAVRRTDPASRSLAATERDEQVLSVVLRLGSASSREIATAAGVSRSTVTNSLVKRHQKLTPWRHEN